MFGYSKTDIEAFEKYNELIKNGVTDTKKLEESMSGASTNAKKLVANSDGAAISIKGLSTAEKIAAVEAKVMGVAFNTALSFGIGLLIQGIITGIDKIVHAEEDAAKKAKELRDEAQKVANDYQNEMKSLSELQNEYIKLYTTTDNLATSKEKLLDIQNKLNDGFSSEKDHVDLLNNSLKEEIELYKKREYEEAKESKRKLESEYQAALNPKGGLDMNGNAYSLDLSQFDKKDTRKVLEEIDQEFVNYFNAETGYITHTWKDSVTGELQSWSFDELNFDRHFNIFSVVGTDQEDALENLGKMMDMYKDWKGYNKEVYDGLSNIYNEIDEQFKANKNIIENYEQASKIVSDYEASLGSDTSNKLNDILETAASKMLELQDATGVTQFRLVQELNELRVEAESLAGDNTVLADSVNSVFANYQSGLSDTLDNVGDFRESWFKALSDIQKDSIKNIDTMKSALQSVANGDNLSSDIFWQLAELDTDHILDGVRMIGDEFQLTEEQIIRLKDTYIQKQIESIQLRQTELEQLKKSEEMEIRQVQALLDKYSAMSLDAHNPNFAANRKAYDELNNRLSVAKENVKQYGEEWSLNAILLRQYNASLGNTADLIQVAQSRAEKLSEAFVGRIDNVIDGINNQKDVLNEEKEALQDQLDILEAQADEIENIISEYEKVADVVKETIEEEISAIEETYNKQIEALKAQNEEREEAIDLTEKLNALNNAKNNKVVTYTEAGGFRYGVNKEAVNKAQNEYDKALIDSQISNLEKERDSATKDLEEYAKLWENATNKATKAEEEELATRILGADWREKISEQDVEIFETYEQKYDEYGVSLNNITKIEIANVKKSIEAKDKEIKAKEDLLKEWQKYKTNVQNYVNDLKNTNKEYEDSIENITLTESSNLDERLANFERFKNEYESMINRILELQDGVGDIEVNASVKMDDFTDGIKEVVDGIGTVSEKLAEAIKELGKMPSINSAGDVKYYQATGYEHYASGGVNTTTGLAWLDGTKSRPEIILNNADATKLYNMLHSMPMSAVQMYTSPFVNTKSGGVNQSSTIQISGNTINLPNVQNPQQFAREMERYLQNTLTESQIIPPRK